MSAFPEPHPVGLAEPELAAWDGLLSVDSTISRKLSAELERGDGLSLTEYYVLAQLARSPQRRMRMTELAQEVRITRGGLTHCVERLERKSLVLRMRSADDRRVAYATLTERGRSRLRTATCTHLRGIREHFLSQITPEERQTLRDIWARLLARDAMLASLSLEQEGRSRGSCFWGAQGRAAASPP